MADQNGTTSRILNRLAYAIGNIASAVGTATTSDKLLGYDDSAGQMKTFDGDNVLEVMGVTSSASELNIMSGVTATAAEINNACDVSTRIVSIADGTNTLALTQADHANRVLLVLDATLAITLPEATGTGDTYTVVQGIAATTSTFVTADTSNAGFRGMLNAFDTDDESTLASWPAAAAGSDDTISFNGTSTGGKIYDHLKFVDIATDVWLVSGQISQSGGSEVTPFSSAA